MNVVGQGLKQGCLSEDQLGRILHDGLAELDLDGRRVLVLIPDSTRTMPMPLVFNILERELAPRVARLDYLVALGTHPVMDDAQLGRLIGREVVDGKTGRTRIFNHRWDDPDTFVTLGTLSAREVGELTGGRLSQDVPVSLNRLILGYDHLLICGPVFPHEVVGFSGGTKYLFPGIAGPEIINFTHWLGALISSYEIIGARETPVRAVIDRAAEFVDRPLSLLALVVTQEGVAGLFCGPIREAWSCAVTLSAQRHIVWLEQPLRRVVSVMPPMYADLWTAAKGMYKLEPAVADGGEVVIYAPHIDEVSYVHGHLIDEIGYHCRDYFLSQWERFGRYPGGVLAHSTHLKGQGTFDVTTGVETPRINVTLATGIPSQRCRRLNLGYLDPARVDVATLGAGPKAGEMVVPRAGELLYRIGRPPDGV